MDENKIYDKINSLKLKAYLNLKNAIDLDESCKYEEALRTYNECVKLLKEILDEISINRHLISARKDLIGKIEDDSKRLYNESIKRINEIQPTNEVIRINDVSVYYIKSLNDQVSSTGVSTFLSIFEFENDTQSKEVYIRLGDILAVNLNMLKENAILKTIYNAYILPNIGTTSEYNHIGVLFNNSDSQLVSLFEDILMNYSILIQQTNEEIIQEEKTDKSKSEIISSYILSTANYVKDGISKVTNVSNNYIDLGSNKIKDTYLNPNDQQSGQASNVQINQNLNRAVEGLRYTTNVGVKVSSYLLSTLQSIASYAGGKAAPIVKQSANSLLVKTGLIKPTSDGSNKDPLDGVYKVANSSVEGFSIIYESLETASKCLAKNLIDKSVNLIDLKYGQDASKLAENSLYTLSNVALCAYNFNNMKITKVIVKSTAKETIKNIIKNHDKDL